MPEKIKHLRIRKFMLHKKKIVLCFKEVTIDLEKLQSAVPSLTSWERTVHAAPSKREKKNFLRKGKGKRRRESVNEKEKKKKKRKGEGK